MKQRLKIALVSLTLLTANAVVAAPEDRFTGGTYDGYANANVVDAAVAVYRGTIMEISATSATKSCPPETAAPVKAEPGAPCG